MRLIIRDSNGDEIKDIDLDVELLREQIYNSYPNVEAEEGPVVSISDGADGIPVKSLVVGIEPVQDLHGYDNPWPAGGKGNLFRTTATTKTQSGVTWTVNADGSVTASGTATGYTDVLIGEALVAGLSGIVTVYGDVNYSNNVVYGRITLLNSNASVIATIYSGGADKTHTIDLSQYNDAQKIQVSLKRNSNSAVSGTYHIQVIEGSTVPTWYPYENICPITGWTGATVTRTGKNLLPFGDLFEEGWTNTLNGITATYSNGHMKVTGTNTSSGWTNIVFYRVAWEGNPYHFGAGTYIMSNNLSITTSIDGGSYVNKANGFTAQESVLVKGFYISVGPNRTVDWDIPLMFVYGSTRPTTYEPYQGETYDITFPSEAGTVYGGSLDVTNGVLTVTDANIASYNGETLPSTWISDRDVYAEGATPTTGAQVVFKLATPITYQLTPTEVQTLLGTNNVWADTGDTSLAYRADTKLYIDGSTGS